MKKSILFLVSTVLVGSAIGIGTVGFAEDKSTNAVVDYTDGGITFDPQVPGDPSASLPNNLNFGSHKIQTTADETWVATTDGVQTSTPTTGHVAVSDNRGGTATGWSVKVTQPTQFAAGSSQLTGSFLTISTGNLTNNVGSTPTGTTSANIHLILIPGQTGPVLSAKANEGAGETSLSLTKFELFVPKNVNKIQANYQTTLNWTFSASPS